MRAASSTSSSSVLERRSRRLKTLTSMTTPSVPGGAVKEASLTSAAFSPKIARKKTLFRSKLCFRFRSDLTDEDIARLHFSTDADNPIFAKIDQRLFRDIWNIACDLFFTEFCIAGSQLKLFDIDRSVSNLLEAVFQR